MDERQIKLKCLELCAVLGSRSEKADPIPFARSLYKFVIDDKVETPVVKTPSKNKGGRPRKKR